jgi:hypothetical protein
LYENFEDVILPAMTEAYAPDPSDPEERDDETIASITPAVMSSLVASNFFEVLDSSFSPAEPSLERERCRGNYEVSTILLGSLGYDNAEIADFIQVLHSQGACCDCEILYNVAEKSRLKAAYWLAKAEGRGPLVTHEPRQ